MLRSQIFGNTADFSPGIFNDGSASVVSFQVVCYHCAWYIISSLTRTFDGPQKRLKVSKICLSYTEPMFEMHFNHTHTQIGYLR